VDGRDKPDHDALWKAIRPFQEIRVTTTASPPIRRAIVLAAGLGQRMRPITDTLPKPLVKIGGKTMLDHALDRLADAGVEEAVVNVHHLAGQVEAHLAGRVHPRITISHLGRAR